MRVNIYQLKISLINSRPEIWRRILVNSDILLVDFHRIIQTTMGWTNSHLHLFTDNNSTYSPREFEVEGTKNSRVVKLSKILKKEGEKILYEYDFGDGWEHSIVLEKIISIPTCIDGERNCPPEDCGGLGGYEELQKIISTPEHSEYDEMMEWLGEKYNPDQISIEKINKDLKKNDYGCIWLE